MPRRRPAKALTALLILALLLAAPSAGAAERRLAPPASARAQAACGVAAAKSAATAEVERVVRGVAPLGGCVTDVTGITHLFVEWAAERDGARGRICVDPEIRSNAWRCDWDTTELEPGAYTVTMVAIDAAGNRGSFDQAYRVDAPAAVTPAPDAEREPQSSTERDPEAGEPPTAAPEPGPLEPPVTEETPEPDAGADPGAEQEGATTPADTTPMPQQPAPAIEPTPVPLAALLEERIAECARLELAPGVRADRSLSLAVLECMRPALEATGAADIALDEIPVPPAIQVAFPSQSALDSADALLPDAVGGVELQLVVDAARSADTPDTPARG